MGFFFIQKNEGDESEMKTTFSNVLFVASESNTYEGTTYHKAKLVDDQGDYSDLKITVDQSQLGSLPQQRTRVNVVCDVVQRNSKTYLQNPVFTLVK